MRRLTSTSKSGLISSFVERSGSVIRLFADGRHQGPPFAGDTIRPSGTASRR